MTKSQLMTKALPEPKQLAAPVMVQLTQTWLDRPIESYSYETSGEYHRGNETYLLPLHRGFPRWATERFIQYRMTEDTHSSCVHAGTASEQKLFLHQQFISAYMAPNMPYRGILLYHDLGSGKTRTALTVAEAYRQAGTKVLILLPATLRPTWFEELKKWGNADIRRPDNYSQLAPANQAIIDQKLDAKIASGYDFVAYNASNTVDQLNRAIGGKNAILAHRLIICDEVHNLISMMANPTGKKGSDVYHKLMNVIDCKFIFLSATPLLNTPFELGLMFNVLRGFMLYKNQQSILFPETRNEFESHFVDLNTRSIKRPNEFKQKILGLVSYYFGGEGEVYPTVINHAPIECPFEDYQFDIYRQAREQEQDQNKLTARHFQQIQAVTGGTHAQLEDINSTYRIFSRLFSNFVLPPTLNRPLPREWNQLIKGKLLPDPNQWSPEQQQQIDQLFHRDEAQIIQFKNGYQQLLTDTDRFKYLINAIKQSDTDTSQLSNLINSEDVFYEDIKSSSTYEEALETILQAMRKDRLSLTTNLHLYSPKMDAMRRIIMVDAPQGSCFVYSFFRILEGINILTAILEQNGFEQLNFAAIDQSNIHTYRRPITPEHSGRYVVYTGNESMEDRSKIRWIFNHIENLRGEVCKVFLGTSAAAEGISLRNVRQVHILEPHWNNVRIQQVVGRARRICSHYDLPPEDRNLTVYQYHMVLTPDQQKTLGEEPSTDQFIYQIASIKEEINKQFLQILKDAAVDCSLNWVHNRTANNPIECFAFPIGSNTVDAFIPYIKGEQIAPDTSNTYRETGFRYVPSLQRKDDSGQPLYYIVDPQKHIQVKTIQITKPGNQLGRRLQGTIYYFKVGVDYLPHDVVVTVKLKEIEHQIVIKATDFKLV